MISFPKSSIKRVFSFKSDKNSFLFAEVRFLFFKKLPPPETGYETKELKCLMLWHVETFSVPWRQDLPDENQIN